LAYRRACCVRSRTHQPLKQSQQPVRRDPTMSHQADPDPTESEQRASSGWIRTYSHTERGPQGAARLWGALGVAWLKPGVSFAAARAEAQTIWLTVDEAGHRLAGDLEGPTNTLWEVRGLRDPQLALMGAAFLLPEITLLSAAVPDRRSRHAAPAGASPPSSGRT
jgi:hypothetical protein